MLGLWMRLERLRPHGSLCLVKLKQNSNKLVNLIVFKSPKKFSKSMVTPHRRRLRGPFVLFTRMSMDFCNRLSGNVKVNREREIHNDLEVDIAPYCEHKLNMKHKKNSNGFSQLFKGGEAAVQSIVAHNVHENIGRVQQGGTSLLFFGHLTEQLDHNESGKDDTGLGHWTVMTLQGDGVQTRLVCGYNPSSNAKLNSGMSYQQHRRFLVTQRKDLTCPRKRFHDDLMIQLNKW
jgi:hypothetical protein